MGAEVLAEVLERDPLVAYGWWADGFLSAVYLLSRARGGSVLPAEPPRPGQAWLESLAAASRGHGGLVLASTGWSMADVDRLAPMVLAPVVVVDTHWSRGRSLRSNVFVYNPAPRGDARGYWPSTALYVATLLPEPHPLLAAAGVVAVLGEAALGNRLYQNMMVRARLDPRGDYQLAHDCAMQAYGLVAQGDPRVHGEAPRSIVEAERLDPCKAILRDALLTGLRAEAEVGLSDVRLDEQEPRAGFRVYYARGWGRHALIVARRLASKGARVAVGYEDESSGYRAVCAWSMKRGDPPLAELLGQLRSRGLRARGMFQGVANFVCAEPVDSLDKALSTIVEEFENRFSSSHAET